ncbi:protein NETWORKED 2B-like isoform X2 [Phragmites australis]|nr:protein NETWORKED 2B-like isoform X2 [Phragmites australis]
MSKEKAEEEISRLQKAILVLQTEKEYVKSSYENGIARYWEIEKQIADTQEEICLIQDEYDAHAAIDDDEARALMTITALRSCQGTVAKLVHNFEELIRIASMESEKTKSLRAQLYAMNGNTDISSGEAGSTDMSENKRVYPITQEILELQPIYEKIDNFFSNSYESSAEEMAEKVDKLIDKVMDLELKFPKQSAQIKQLKQENENLKNKLDELQDEMALRDDPSDLDEQLKLLEDELNRVRVLERSIIEEEVFVSTAFSEVFSCITNISKALGSIGPEDLYNLSTAAGNGATVSGDVGLENFTKENTLIKGREFRDIEAPRTGDSLGRDREDVSEVVDNNSSGGTDGIYDSKNGEEKILNENCFTQEVREQKSIHYCKHINPFVSLKNENGFDNSGEGKIDSSLEEVGQSSLGGNGTNKTWDMENDGTENFAQGKILKGECPSGIVSQTHLLHSGSIYASDKKYDSNEDGSSVEAAESPVEVAESSLGGSNKIQVLKNVGDGNYFTGSSVVQEERLKDTKSQKIYRQISLVGSANLNSLKEEDAPEETSLPEADRACFSASDRSLDFWHTDEAKSVKELPKLGGQLNAPENILSLNKCSKVEEPVEDGHISFGHVDNVQDMKDNILVDAFSSEARDGTSLCAPTRNSEETEGLHPQVSQVPTDSENMASDICHIQLEKKNSNGKGLASKASTLCNHGGRSQCEKSALTGEEGVPSWREFLLDGREGREATILADYTSVLRNYKETKRRLAELEKKNQVHLEETKAVIRELRNANSMKYVEIQSLRNLLDSSEMPPSEASSDTTGFSSMRSFRETDRTNGTLDREISTVEEINFSHNGAPKKASPVEVKFRNEIDALVEENLQLLVRYSMACHCMQDFDRKYQELQSEMEFVEDKKAEESDSAAEPEPAEKKLRELRTELDVWFEQNALLDQDVQLKTTYLCRLQEEIAKALRASSEIGARFTPYEAAKFQGEVLNMQQSNSKIESELQVALEHMRELQAKINDALRRLRESFELSSRRLSQPETESSYQNQFKHFPSRTRVPLRNFLFGTKRKKKSIFACINPTLQKQFSDL